MSLAVILIVASNIVFRLFRRSLMDALSGRTTSEEDLNRIDNIVMFVVCGLLALVIANPLAGSDLVLGVIKCVAVWFGLVIAYATIVVFLRLFQR